MSSEPSTSLLPGETPASLRAVHLVVIEGPDRGARLRVAISGARVGTGISSHLRLKDPTVSRVHCEIELRPQGVRVVDAGSTNGTFLDSVSVRDVELAQGARLRLGGTTIELVFGDEPAIVPVASATSFGEVLGASLEMRRLYAVLERGAPTNSTILVEGETGTGKELVARAIHAASPRRTAPFVPVDCGAIATTLLESELFGHVRGAFSGAVSDRPGLFEEADGGTVFLDEIGELPLHVQAKLLRALESREIRRLGANTVRRVDVRLVAATNRSLSRAVNEGGFREDLYYRLAVIEAHLPPLRTRRDDIRVLAQHFWTRYGGDPPEVPVELMSSLVARSWPGNVRELRNFIERCVSLGWEPFGEPDVGAAQAPADALAGLPLDLPLKEARHVWSERFEVLYARALLAKTQGNVTRAAEIAGVNRRYFQRLLARRSIRET